MFATARGHVLRLTVGLPAPRNTGAQEYRRMGIPAHGNTGAWACDARE
jgi:hypothetical protein